LIFFSSTEVDEIVKKSKNDLGVLYVNFDEAILQKKLEFEDSMIYQILKLFKQEQLYHNKTIRFVLFGSFVFLARAGLESFGCFFFLI